MCVIRCDALIENRKSLGTVAPQCSMTDVLGIR